MKRFFFSPQLLFLLVSSTLRKFLGGSRVTLILVDGSRILGNSTIDSVSVKTSDDQEVDVPFSQVLSIKTRTKMIQGETKTRVIVTKKENRPRKIKGVMGWSSMDIETIFGKLDIKIEHIRKLLIMSVNEDDVTGEEDDIISFDGVKWHPWRTPWEIQGDRLVSLPKPRPGFDYGHSGNGRGANLATNVGNKDWKDYSVRFKMGMLDIDPSFNPYNLPEAHGGKHVGICFHVADAKESWNEKGFSSYRVVFSEKRRDNPYSWQFAKSYNQHTNRPTINREGHERFAESEEAKLFDGEQGATVQIDVVGNRIQIWINDEKIVDVTDEKMGETIGGHTVDHGGIVIYTPYEDRIWISDFSITHI